VPALKIDPLAVADGRTTPDDAVAFVGAATRTALVYSSDDPAEVRRAQDILGRDRAGTLVEGFHAAVAERLHARGYRRFVVAGGETSGAVVEALNVAAMRIGPEIDPGVPWTTSVDDQEPVSLALKSGNFGADDFFIKAWTLAP
jgi:uncharacterized protein YgbK (DUF1537 family)